MQFLIRKAVQNIQKFKYMLLKIYVTEFFDANHVILLSKLGFMLWDVEHYGNEIRAIHHIRAAMGSEMFGFHCFQSALDIVFRMQYWKRLCNRWQMCP